ncbi:hypothetical protein HYC85_005767 [Camellia sinensis]|uniref:Uncharacterized protein n=1 Tax=Camellia sinensis TaxID=4442 RepID=A0A7J7I0F4_CAMSI|nr:hypothetical protein HYC85_005767 [Camellia sinensis]
MDQRTNAQIPRSWGMPSALRNMYYGVCATRWKEPNDGDFTLCLDPSIVY